MGRGAGGAGQQWSRSMRWSFPLVQVAGSEIRIHLTFFLLLAWFAIAHYQQGGWPAAADGLLYIVAVFACVVLHELGHAIAARRYGIRTPRITLLPIGGLAELERIPEKPIEEIVVAIAGPLVNVAIAAFLILVLGASVGSDAVAAIEDPHGDFLARVAAVNVVLVLFNLIPAFPMDGGRVLRALLATRLERARATQIAAMIGQGLALAFAFLGLIGGNPLLIFIAIFIYLAATGEAEATSLQEMATRIPLAEVTITQFRTLGMDASLGEAAEALLSTTQHEFPVVDGHGRLQGMLTRGALVEALSRDGRKGAVAGAMETEVPSVREGAQVSKVLASLRDSKAAVVAVVDASGRLIGYVNRENLAEMMMVRNALA
jgi:Zn-dependent protease/CBS domain-containing protein